MWFVTILIAYEGVAINVTEVIVLISTTFTFGIDLGWRNQNRLMNPTEHINLPSKWGIQILNIQALHVLHKHRQLHSFDTILDNNEMMSHK